MRITGFLLLILFPILLFSQGNDPYVISQQGWVKMGVVYQGWYDKYNYKLNETSVPYQVYFPFNRSVALSLRGSHASVQGTGLATLRGLSDTQLILTTHMESAHLVFNLGVNIPNGKTELSAEEFDTSTLISLNILNFYTPNLGQGLNIAPSLTWAMPISDNFVLGLGASYQIKGKYKPIEWMEEDYHPGNELSVTAGFDLRLAETRTFSGDVLWTKYGEDRIGSETVFRSGDRLVATVQYRQYFGYNQLWILGRYRTRAKNSLAVAGKLVPEEYKTIPDQIELFTRYRMRLGRNLNLEIVGEYFKINKTMVFVNANVYGLGLAPEVRLSKRVALPIDFLYRIEKDEDEGSEPFFCLEVQAGLQIYF